MPRKRRRSARNALEAGGEVGRVAGHLGVLTHAGDRAHSVILQIMRADPGALVGVGDRVAALEAPLARGGDRAPAPVGAKQNAEEAEPR